MATTDKRDKKERDERRRQAVAALQALLKRVRQLCSTVEQLGRWSQILADVRQVFLEWQDALPAKARKRLEQALQKAEQADRVWGNLKTACRVLQKGLQGTITAASATPGFPLKGMLVGMAGAVVVGAGIAVPLMAPSILKRQLVSIQVHNDCGDSLRYGTWGIGSPEGEIPPRGTKTVTLLAVKVGVHRDSEHMVVSFLNQKLRFPVDPRTSVELNGSPIARDFSGSFDLGEREEHSLLIRCR